jgi:hypothetical protein
MNSIRKSMVARPFQGTTHLLRRAYQVEPMFPVYFRTYVPGLYLGIGHRWIGPHRLKVYDGTARSAPTYAPNSNAGSEHGFTRPARSLVSSRARPVRV